MNSLDPAAWEVDPRALQNLLSVSEKPGTQSIRLVDCREEDEFALCRLGGAELIPLSRFAEIAPSALTDESRPIVVYCHHGMRSLNATQYLRERGIPNVWSLAGGIERWSTEIDSSVPRY